MNKICIIIKQSHLNDMEIPGTKHFIPKEFELGTTFIWPIWSIDGFQPHAMRCITQQQIMAHDYDDDYNRNSSKFPKDFSLRALFCAPTWLLWRQVKPYMERFHSRDQQPYWITETKESICIKIESNSRRISLVHHHGRHSFVLEHQHGGRDVTWKRSIGYFTVYKFN